MIVVLDHVTHGSSMPMAASCVHRCCSGGLGVFEDHVFLVDDICYGLICMDVALDLSIKYASRVIVIKAVL